MGIVFFFLEMNEMIIKSPRLHPQTPTMVVWNDMDQGMIPKALSWECSELYLSPFCVFHLRLSSKTASILAKTGIPDFLEKSVLEISDFFCVC